MSIKNMFTTVAVLCLCLPMSQTKLSHAEPLNRGLNPWIGESLSEHLWWDHEKGIWSIGNWHLEPSPHPLHTPLDTMQCLNVSTPSIPSCISKSTQGKAASDYKPYAVNSQKFLLELFTEFGIQWCWQEFSPPWTWQIECSCSPHKASIIHFLLSKKTYFPSCTYLFFHTLLLFVYVFSIISHI